MNISDIKDNYKTFEDSKIKHLALNEVASLRPEVIEILKEEIKTRNLSENLLNSIEIQLHEPSESEINNYAEILKNHECPICKSKTQTLKISSIGEVVSIIVMTNYNKTLKVGCEDCLTELNNKAITKSAILGWWGIPWGPVQTIRSFIYNSQMKKNNRINQQNEHYHGLIYENIGVFEMAKKDPKVLTNLLRKINQN